MAPAVPLRGRHVLFGCGSALFVRLQGDAGLFADGFAERFDSSEEEVAAGFSWTVFDLRTPQTFWSV